MPWDSSPEKRRRDSQVYGDPEYKRNRAVRKRQAGGRCEQCRHPHGRLQCDHAIPVTQGGTHALANLRMLCAGQGTCRCHEKKTAQEGGGYRSGNAAEGDPEPRPRTAW